MAGAEPLSAPPLHRRAWRFSSLSPGIQGQPVGLLQELLCQRLLQPLLAQSPPWSSSTAQWGKPQKLLQILGLILLSVLCHWHSSHQLLEQLLLVPSTVSERGLPISSVQEIAVKACSRTLLPGTATASTLGLEIWGIEGEQHPLCPASTSQICWFGLPSTPGRYPGI